MPFTIDFFAESIQADVAAKDWFTSDIVDADGRYLMSLPHLGDRAQAPSHLSWTSCPPDSKERPPIPVFTDLLVVATDV